MIHTDICGQFLPCIAGEKYFITFIDAYSRYCYVYLLKEKFEAVNALAVFWAEVTNQLDKRIKVMRLDRGGEYYGRHTDLGQSEGPFAIFSQVKGNSTPIYNLGHASTKWCW